MEESLEQYVKDMLESMPKNIKDVTFDLPISMTATGIVVDAGSSCRIHFGVQRSWGA